MKNDMRRLMEAVNEAYEITGTHDNFAVGWLDFEKLKKIDNPPGVIAVIQLNGSVTLVVESAHESSTGFQQSSNVDFWIIDATVELSDEDGYKLGGIIEIEPEIGHKFSITVEELEWFNLKTGSNDRPKEISDPFDLFRVLPAYIENQIASVVENDPDAFLPDHSEYHDY